jgi:hypothetical protein
MDDEVDEEDSAGPAADGYPVTYIVSICLSSHSDPFN